MEYKQIKHDTAGFLLQRCLKCVVQPSVSLSSVTKLRNDEGPLLLSCNRTPGFAGHVLRSLKLLPPTKPTGVCIYVHGKFQHQRSVELEPLKKELLGAGFAWYGMDAPGHGMSGRLGDPESMLAPALVPSMMDYVQDLIEFVKLVAAETGDLPIVIMGHSWGTALQLLTIPQLQELLGSRLRGACMSSTCCLQPVSDAGLPNWWKLAPWKTWWAAQTTPEKFLSVEHATIPGLDLKFSCRDVTMREKLKKDQLRYHLGDDPMWTKLQVAEGNVRGRSGQIVKQINIPLHITHGTADISVNMHCAAHLHIASKTPIAHKHMQLLKGATHNLFADPLSGNLVSEWVAFIKKAISGEFLTSV